MEYSKENRHKYETNFGSNYLPWFIISLLFLCSIRGGETHAAYEFIRIKLIN